MTVVVVVLCFESLPFGVLISLVSGCSLTRRPRFWLRLAGVVLVMLLPDLVGVVARPSEQTVGVLLWLGLAWGIMVVVLARFVLFAGERSDPGADDDGGGGPDPGDDRPTPPDPIGGIPLPDAEPSSMRLRDHPPPRRALRPRRPTRPRERRPSRLWHLRLWPS